MDFSLEGKAAIVTGGTRGIGYAIAHSLADAGAAVAICGRSQTGTANAVKELSKSTTEGKVVGHQADISNPEDVSRFFAFAATELGRLDILVNNAGLGIFHPTAELTNDEWRTVIDTNLNGVFYCCREAIPLMRRVGGGSILNISSLAGKNPFAGGAAYNASKFALNGFSEAMMLDHRNENIRVSYIMPGSVDTAFGRGTPGGTWKIAPEDVAQIVLDILRMPQRTLISRVEVRPSKPPK